jgi:hypothetical protein
LGSITSSVNPFGGNGLKADAIDGYTTTIDTKGDQDGQHNGSSQGLRCIKRRFLMTSSERYTACFVLCLVFCALGRAQAQTPDLNKVWTTVGSDGTIDETDVRKVFFNKSIVQMGQPGADSQHLGAAAAKPKPAAIPGVTQSSAVIRYNITPVNGLFTPGFRLRLRYLDAGPSGRVVAKLIEVDLASGSEMERLTFDSNAFAPNAKYQVRAGNCGGQSFDFVRKSYYIEAKLTADNNAILVGGSAAGIQTIKIENGCAPT